MDVEGIDPIDILAFTSDELRKNFAANINTDTDHELAILKYLQGWDYDPAMKKVKELKFQFDKDLEWFNVTQPLSLSDVHGKIVVLDFFTYCCINCMHVFPELKVLETRFSIEDGFLVIGVHSPKFENEKDSSNILSAIQRYNITHPIVNDPSSSLWNNLRIKCWPTLLLLSPTGLPLLLLMGEGHGKFLEQFTRCALQYFVEKGQIMNFKISLHASSDVVPASNLKFPAKIARLVRTRTEENSDECFAVADAGNNRILIFDNRGIVLHRIGGPEPNLINGDFEKARFNSPQGVAFISASVLVVADTENHAIRQISLLDRQVTTLVGTGEQGTDRVGGKSGVLQEISSPWDVAVLRSRDMDMSFHIDEKNVPEKIVILIAMAGVHQIWGYFPEGMIWWKFKKVEPLTCLPLIGNGLEENRNNSYPQNAAFAQPSGLALANEYLFIADSESSSVRKASMVDGKVMAVVGGDRNPLNLFAFGDVDGKQYNAKLQHPLGLSYNDKNNRVYVADTYNHKIKVIDIETNCIETCKIHAINEPSKLYHFNEPAGVCCDASGNKLLVADTNNHKIQIVDLDTMSMYPINLDFRKVRNPGVQTSSNEFTDSPGVLQLRKYLILHGCKEVQLNVIFKFKDNLKFTPGAPQTYNCNSSNFMLRTSNNLNEALEDGVHKLKFERLKSEADSPAVEDIHVNFNLNLCDTNSCVSKRFSLIIANADIKNRSSECSSYELNLSISKNSIKLS